MILIRWLINALALLIIANLFPGFHLANFYSALWVALLLGLLNAIVRPVLIFLTLPITILTLGLFTFIINATLLIFVSSVVKGFTIDNFGTAVAASVLLWFIGWATNSFAKK